MQYQVQTWRTHSLARRQIVLKNRQCIRWDKSFDWKVFWGTRMNVRLLCRLHFDVYKLALKYIMRKFFRPDSLMWYHLYKGWNIYLNPVLFQKDNNSWVRPNETPSHSSFSFFLSSNGDIIAISFFGSICSFKSPTSCISFKLFSSTSGSI